MKMTRAAMVKTGGREGDAICVELPTKVADDQPGVPPSMPFVPEKEKRCAPPDPFQEAQITRQGRQCQSESQRKSSSIPTLNRRNFVSHHLMRCTCLGSIGAVANIATWPYESCYRMVGSTCRSSPKKMDLAPRYFCLQRGLAGEQAV